MSDLGPVLEAAITRAVELVLGSGHLVALVGAGMSVESGIPPFRGPGGLWSSNLPPASLSYQRFVSDPAAWWEQRLRDEQAPETATYKLKVAVDAAAPNAGHYALAELERMGRLRYVITQNVDNLHHVAGSVNVGEIHGNRTKLRCIGCGVRFSRQDYYPAGAPGGCHECGGVLKIDSVMFGEPIPRDVLALCLDQVERCDCMLMIGTSGTVRPASELPLAARERGARLIEINPLETSLTEAADVVLMGASGDVLPALVSRVRDAING